MSDLTPVTWCWACALVGKLAVSIPRMSAVEMVEDCDCSVIYYSCLVAPD